MKRYLITEDYKDVYKPHFAYRAFYVRANSPKEAKYYYEKHRDQMLKGSCLESDIEDFDFNKINKNNYTIRTIEAPEHWQTDCIIYRVDDDSILECEPS